VYCIAAEITAEGVPAGSRLWSFSDGGSLKAVFSSPAVADGRLYVGEGYHQDQHCRLFCLDARGGDRPLWTLRTASHVESSPTFADGLLYFGAGDEGLLCVAPRGLSVISGSSGYNGTVPIAANESPAAPQLVWKIPGLHIDSSPAVAEGRVFVGSVVGDVQHDLFAVAADAKTGQVIWKIPAPLPLAGAPACLAGRVVFSLGNGKLDADADKPEGRLWCLDAASGERQWEFRAEGSILSSPAALDGKVFCCSRDRHCYSLRDSDGDVLWKRDLGEPIVASPVVTHRAVYVLTTSGTLFCLDASSGEITWRIDDLKNDDDDAYSSPALVDGRLYVASGGKLFCLGDKPQP
jgi:outer membrane protein assembly factor BamB